MNRQNTNRFILNRERLESGRTRIVRRNKFNDKPTPKSTIEYVNRQITEMNDLDKWKVATNDSWLRQKLKYDTGNDKFSGQLPTNVKYVGTGINPFFELSQDILKNIVGKESVDESYRILCMKVK
jgi:hypothetical protein